MHQSLSSTNKGKLVHDIFTRIARNYDWTNALFSLWQDKRWRRIAIEHCHPQPGEHGLDLGCGTGKIAFELARAINGRGIVTGLDFNEAMLTIAEQRLENFPYRRCIHLVQGNAMALPFSDSSFDYVIAGFLLRNVERMEKALTEMIRVVKPGGRMIILELSQPKLQPFQQLYRFYFHHVMPQIGKIICGSDIPYSYLPASVQSFQNPETFRHTLTQNGLEHVAFYSLSGGIAVLHKGIKKAAR